jgi:YVTN family beta-propeller protein
MKKATALLFIIAFVSCKKDKPEPAEPEVPVVVQPSQQRVLVLNEGKFTSENASVSLYNVATGEVTKEYYQAQNANTKLGDIAQSMTKIGDKYYIVVNNSKKVVVCDKDMKKLSEITNVISPRHILPVNDNKAYVTDMSANGIHILDLGTNTITGLIPCSGSTERLARSGNEIFVLNTMTGKMYIINPATDKITDSVAVGDNPAYIDLDKNGKLWVLAQGESWKNNAGQLTRIDPASRAVELKLPFATADFPSSLCFNKTKDTLLFLNSGVWRMPVSSTSKPASAFIAAGSRNFYGLGVNPANHTIYVADALDYSQASTIYIYDNAGTEKSFFKAGVNANSFYFE